MVAKFECNYKLLDLEVKLKQVQDGAEKTLNDVLHGEAIEMTAKEITKFIPISRDEDGVVRTKRHAKQVDWWDSDKHNLGFTIKAKGGASNKPGSFGYLVFPEEGRGPYNHIEQEFMKTGLEKVTGKIIDRLQEEVTKKIQEVL
ncbi:hypothetical protein LC087_19450 (plasmid) [Bacillus carboniphilus]|uniref:HK97 gp10 family phage protein n=1 Tax=Bacillus carboniphilus TaxID=86663 RepID=A0ABY9JYM6_9BACI|nr:hypothetical protein [Bacillus carboniphilus]WLR44479.1 hypothetical protein LC087_19450 [Bacillus carboniphilus]